MGLLWAGRPGPRLRVHHRLRDTARPAYPPSYASTQPAPCFWRFWHRVAPYAPQGIHLVRSGGSPVLAAVLSYRERRPEPLGSDADYRRQRDAITGSQGRAVAAGEANEASRHQLFGGNSMRLVMIVLVLLQLAVTAYSAGMSGLAEGGASWERVTLMVVQPVAALGLHLLAALGLLLLAALSQPSVLIGPSGNGPVGYQYRRRCRPRVEHCSKLFPGRLAASPLLCGHSTNRADVRRFVDRPEVSLIARKDHRRPPVTASPDCFVASLLAMTTRARRLLIMTPRPRAAVG